MSAAPQLDCQDTILARARQFLRENRSNEAYACYLEVLARNPAHAAALHELGCLAHAEGLSSAAETVFRQIVCNWPHDLIGHVNLGNILYEKGELEIAAKHFEAALAIDENSPDAHRGLGQIRSDQGNNEVADWHWRRSFPGQAVTSRVYRGTSWPTPVLLLVSARGGNIPTGNILDDRSFAVTALYTEYYKPDLPLPPHALVFNAIGDADLCHDGLAAAEQIMARTTAPLINQPSRVRCTGRAANAIRLATIPNVRAPRILALHRNALSAARALPFPLLIRAQGFHTGQHFARVERQEEVESTIAGMPGETLLAIEYLDVRGSDGLARKYRVMFIDGALYPMHLAISANWKVHYFASDMASNAEHRAEEQQFLEDMPSVLGPTATLTLLRIGQALGLDYGGIDFALDDEGSVIVFEANATMVISRPPPEQIWDYRRAPIERVFRAVKDMLAVRSPPNAICDMRVA